MNLPINKKTREYIYIIPHFCFVGRPSHAKLSRIVLHDVLSIYFNKESPVTSNEKDWETPNAAVYWDGVRV